LIDSLIHSFIHSFININILDAASSR